MVRRGMIALGMVMCCGLATAPAAADSTPPVEGVRPSASSEKQAIAKAWRHRSQGEKRTVAPMIAANAVDCPPGATAEGEPDCFDQYVDATNGGCNSDPAVFGSISAGETICGTMGTYLFDDPEFGPSDYRDTDWFTFTVTELSTVTFSGTGDAEMLIGILDGGDCNSIGGFLTSAVVPAGSPGSVEAVLAAGTWTVFVSPSVFAGVACGTEYAVTLETEPFVLEEPEATDLGEIAGDLDYFSIGICESVIDSEFGLWDADGNLLAVNDDGCGVFAGPSLFSGINLPQGRYYFSVSGYNTAHNDFFVADPAPDSAAGTYDGTANDTPFSGEVASGEVDWFTFTIGEGGGCDLTCPDGGIAEGEPDCGEDYEDTTNGGCNSEPPVFSSIACGETVCGTAGTYIFNDPVDGPLNFRDTDWYEIVLDEPSTVTVTATSNFPGLFGFLQGNGQPGCDNLTGSFSSSMTTIPCEEGTMSTALPAGTWYIFAGTSVFEGVPCGSEYVMSVSCEPIVVVQPDAIDLGQVAGSGELVTIDTCGSTFDTELGLYSEDGVLLANVDDTSFCGGFTVQSAIVDMALADGRYYFSVSGYNTNFGQFFGAVPTATSAGGDYTGTAGDTDFSGTVGTGELVWYTFTVGATCAADHNGDGERTVQDLIGFLQDFGDGLDSAEYDGEPGISVGDLIAYLQAFSAGC